MRHRVAGVKLGRTGSHRKAMFRNMVTSLILCDRIETTLPKAKEVRRWADKMVTLAKKNTVAARREAMKVLKDKDALKKLFSTFADRYKDRAGGYTRIYKLGKRHGDNAQKAIIEYLTAEVKTATGKKDLTKKKAAPKKKAAVKKTAAKKASAKKIAPKKAAFGKSVAKKAPVKKAVTKGITNKAK